MADSLDPATAIERLVHDGDCVAMEDSPTCATAKVGPKQWSGGGDRMAAAGCLRESYPQTSPAVSTISRSLATSSS